MHTASAIPSDLVTQALPTWRVLAAIIADPAPTFGPRSSIEDLRENPIVA
jgi:hypothetical protein